MLSIMTKLLKCRRHLHGCGTTAEVLNFCTCLLSVANLENLLHSSLHAIMGFINDRVDAGGYFTSWRAKFLQCGECRRRCMKGIAANQTEEVLMWSRGVHRGIMRPKRSSVTGRWVGAPQIEPVRSLVSERQSRPTCIILRWEHTWDDCFLHMIISTGERVELVWP